MKITLLWVMISIIMTFHYTDNNSDIQSTMTTQYDRQLMTPLPSSDYAIAGASLIKHEEGESIVAKDGSTECFIPTAIPKPVSDPIICASFPGSGAKLTWKLVRAVTGIMTGDDFDHNGLASKGQVITIKTHYPSQIEEEDFEVYRNTIKRSILLLRNPMYAIPSLCNFKYEVDNNLPGHSTRAPLENWLKWRDSNLTKELQNWVDHVQYWMNQYPYERRLIVTYENFIDEQYGAKELLRLAQYLNKDSNGQIRNVLRQPSEEYPCIWRHVVQRRADEGTLRNSMRRTSKNDAARPYTSSQIQMIKNELSNLQKQWPGQLGPIMDQYIQTLESTVSIE